MQKTLVFKGFIEDSTVKNGGAEEIRTLDPHVANVVLYQLSYRPMQVTRFL